MSVKEVGGVLDESLYPNIYAIAYLLGHGDRLMKALSTLGYDAKELEHINFLLGQMYLADVVNYTFRPGPVPAEFAKINTFMYKSGMLDYTE